MATWWCCELVQKTDKCVYLAGSASEDPRVNSIILGGIKTTAFNFLLFINLDFLRGAYCIKRKRQ